MFNITRQGFLQVVAYGVFCALLLYFSTSPPYHYLKPGQAEVKLAFKHAAKRKEACRKRSQEELMRLAPNMRRPQECSRERAPLLVELLLDGNLAATETFIPPGIHKDGTAYVYAKFPLPAGDHLLTVRMRDSNRTEGFDYAADRKVVLESGQSLVIGLDGTVGRFIFY